MAYITADDVLDFANLQAGARSRHRPDAEVAAASACLAVNQWCQRSFTVPTSATARTFVPTDCYLLKVPDIASITGLVVANNGTTIASTGYQLEIAPGKPGPFNSAEIEEPWQYIRLLGSTWYVDSYGEATVTVTARWGWPTATPDTVPLCAKYLARDMMPQAVVVNELVDFGGAQVAPSTAQKVGRLLAPFKRVEAWGIV